MALNERQEPVFDLIKSMSKAEKRNFKLYAMRLAGNQEAKFLMLFDYLDSAEEYDEAKVLARCPIKKEQLPNMKAHLYRQILTSMRMLNVQHSETMQLREQFEFAQILFDKGLYRQSAKILDKLKEQAAKLEEYSIELDVVYLQGKLDMTNVNVKRDLVSLSESAERQVNRICGRIATQSELSGSAKRLYSLHQKLGYVRTQKDLDMIILYFQPRLDAYAARVKEMSFRERFYYYQAWAWYYYIQHNFVKSYYYSQLWVDLFDANPQMKPIMYDDYMKGCAQILEGLYLMRKNKRFVEKLNYFEKEFEQIEKLSTNAYVIANRIIYTNKIHKCFIEGGFKQGLLLVKNIERFIKEYSNYLDMHFKMLLYYKIACLYFGDENYVKCIEYLSLITSTKSLQVGRDLQCYARILNLIASYEAGMDYNIDYQIRSVYSFLVKMNDLNGVQREILSFLKKLNTLYAHDLKSEFKKLHERLQPYEDHPYERRSFYYLDMLSWLESKITGKSVAGIIQSRSAHTRS